MIRIAKAQNKKIKIDIGKDEKTLKLEILDNKKKLK